MPRVADINPMILKWARETAGLSVDEAAPRVGFANSSKSSASDKLDAVEQGKTAPTRRQLERMSTVYHRPMTTFYRRQIPAPEDHGVDFRTHPAAVAREINGRLDALIRDVLVKQRIVKSILEDDEDSQSLPFVGALSHDTSVDKAVGYLNSFFEVREKETPGQRFATADALFNALRRKLESEGVFVLLLGNLGSHHTTISETAFRGFAIADSIAPFIIINDQDAKAARSFTLVHEFVHVLIGATGISGPPPIESAGKSVRTIERFCNDVSGNFLLPDFAMRLDEHYESTENAIPMIDMISKRHKVSEAMIAYRMWRKGILSAETYSTLAAYYAERWRAFKERQRERGKENENGPSYFVIKKHKLGQPILNLVGEAIRSNEMTYTKAAQVLGVSPNNVKKLISSSGEFGSHGGNEVY